MNGQQLLGFFRRNPIGVVCGALSVVLAVLVYFRSDALASAEEKLEETTALGKRYAANLTHAAQLKEQYEGLVAANKAIEERFARASQLTQNLQYFYKLEADTGVRMTVTPVTQAQSVAAAMAAKKSLIPVAFSVSVQGDYASVIEFLRRVEQGAYYSRVLTCTLNAAGMAGVDTGGARGMTLGLSVELLGLP